MAIAGTLLRSASPAPPKRTPPPSPALKARSAPPSPALVRSDPPTGWRSAPPSFAPRAALPSRLRPASILLPSSSRNAPRSSSARSSPSSGGSTPSWDSPRWKAPVFSKQSPSPSPTPTPKPSPLVTPLKLQQPKSKASIVPKKSPVNKMSKSWKALEAQSVMYGRTYTRRHRARDVRHTAERAARAAGSSGGN